MHQSVCLCVSVCDSVCLQVCVCDSVFFFYVFSPQAQYNCSFNINMSIRRAVIAAGENYFVLLTKHRKYSHKFCV